MTPSAHFGNPQQLIAAARDGMALNAKALQEFVCGMADGRTTEGQMAAFAMAVRCRGLNTEDTTTLTLAMRDSGDRLTRADLGTPQTTDILRTGDVAQRDATGLFRIVGRLSRLVKLNGLRIGLDDIERSLRGDGHRVYASGDDSGIVLSVASGTRAGPIVTHFDGAEERDAA